MERVVIFVKLMYVNAVTNIVLLIPCMFNIMLQIYQHMYFYLLKINSSLKCPTHVSVG